MMSGNNSNLNHATITQQVLHNQNSSIISTNGTPTSESNGSGQLMHQPVAHVPELGAVNTPDQHLQHTHMQHQNRYPHRDGPATINLPPGTRIQQATIIPNESSGATAQQQSADATTATATANIYGQHIYQQHTTANSPATYIQTGYGQAAQMAPTGQYYYNPATGQYYPNAAGGGYAVTPQALIMQQPYHQIINQSHQPITGSHGHQMIATAGGVPQQQAGVGISTTPVSQFQQTNVVVTSAGNVVPQSMPSNVPAPAPPKPKKILKFVDPSSGEALKFGTDSKPPPSSASANASDEESKSAVIKTEFLKKVSERVKDEAVIPTQKRSPSSFTEPDMPPHQLSEQEMMKNATVGDTNAHMNLSSIQQLQHQQPILPFVPAPMPIPSEHTSPRPKFQSPHNLQSILELKFPPQPPMIAHPQKQTVEPPPAVIQQPTLGIVISPAVEEQKIAVNDKDQTPIVSDEKHGNVRDSIDQEQNGQTLSPTEEVDNLPSEEDKLRELEEEMQTFENNRTETHDPDAMIYSRSYLMFLRKVTQMIKTVKCPRTEEELDDLGLSKKGVTSSQFNVSGKSKRFDMGSGDSMFKPSWAQQPGGGGGTQSRFGNNRPPNYMGRHSDNKMKQKKGPIGRPSLDQRQPIKLAQIQQQNENAISKRSANAWKSKREERFDMNAPQKDEDEVKYEKLKKEIRGLLNKITPSTYDELSNDFCAYKIIDDPRLLTLVIDLIFDKAVEEPHFCPLYSDLCKKQVDVERHIQAQAQRDKTPDGQLSQSSKQEIKTFRNEIIFKSQRTFQASQMFDEKMKELEEKLKEIDQSDEKGRAQIEEEIEMRRSKEKRRLLGILKFIGQLYRHQLLIETIIDWCSIELIKRFEATKDEVYIEYAVELVETVGKIYEQRRDASLQAYAARQKTAAQVLSGQEQKPEYRLEMVLSHLIQLKPSVSNRVRTKFIAKKFLKVRFAIMDLEDLRNTKWVPRGGEKGPKTIEEVREEVEKEQQENELERMEHEKQKEKDKLQPLRKSSGRAGYGGRSSADRRQAAAASSASLHSRESKAESRITGMSRLSDLDNMPLGRKTWQSHRDRTPQKESSGSGTPSGGTGEAWRSNKSGTDSPKEE